MTRSVFGSAPTTYTKPVHPPPAYRLDRRPDGTSSVRGSAYIVEYRRSHAGLSVLYRIVLIGDGGNRDAAHDSWSARLQRTRARCQGTLWAHVRPRDDWPQDRYQAATAGGAVSSHHPCSRTYLVDCSFFFVVVVVVVWQGGCVAEGRAVGSESLWLCLQPPQTLAAFRPNAGSLSESSFRVR